jgi:hypothetical protein
MPRGIPNNPRPNQEIQRRVNARKDKVEKHAKLTLMKTTDKWKQVVDALVEDKYRPTNKTLSGLTALIQNCITNQLFNVSVPVVSSVLIKEYLHEKYADDIETKYNQLIINEIHFKQPTNEELKDIWNKIDN